MSLLNHASIHFITFIVLLNVIRDVVCNKDLKSSEIHTNVIDMYKTRTNKEEFIDILVAKLQKGLNGLLNQTMENTIEEARKKKSRPQEKGMMEKILPMMVIPFMVSTSMIPMMLVSLKFMLIKSAFIGKIAIILMLLNFLRRRIDGGGVYSHNVNANDLAMDHYGYHGGMEYGAYVNRKKKRRKRSLDNGL